MHLAQLGMALMSETLSTAACSRPGAVPNPAIRREQFSRDAARRPANAPPLQSLRGHTASKEIRTVSFPLFLLIALFWCLALAPWNCTSGAGFWERWESCAERCQLPT